MSLNVSPARDLVRRLRRSEQGALEELCNSDTRWASYFRDHKSWLKRALSDVSGPGRAVFGHFSPIIDSTDSATLRLDACVFLKPSDFDNSAELKNLVVRSGTGTTGHGGSFAEIARPLLHKAIRYCQAREIDKLEMELPQNEHMIISLMLEIGFRVAALRERYLPGQSVCVLEKTIGETYNADPFDLRMLARWLLRASLPSRITDEVPLELLGEGSAVPCLLFEGYPIHPAFSKENPKGYEKRVRGSLVIFDEGEATDESVASLVATVSLDYGPLRYVLADGFSPASKTLLEAKGFTLLEMNEVREIAGGVRSSLSIPMEKSEVGGVITILEEEFVREYSRHEQFVYYLLSGLGSNLDESKVVARLDEGDTGLLLAIYCPQWRDRTHGIVATAEIEDFAYARFEDASTIFSDIPRALKDDDLAFYKTRNDRDRIPILKCSLLRIADAAIGVRDGSLGLDTDMQDYLARALEESNLVYIDRTSCGSLRRRFTELEEDRPVAAQAKADKASEGAATAGRRSRKVVVLFLAANPLSTTHLDLEQELKDIQMELRGVKYRGSIRFVAQHAVTPDDLVRYVSEHRPHVIHFSGHGSPEGIWLRTDEGQDQIVEAESLRQFLADRKVRLVLLNSCYSKVQADSILSAVETVVGTTDTLDDQAGRRFSAAFYRSLGNGGKVGEAFKDGADSVALHSLPDVFHCDGDRHLCLVGPNRTTQPPET